MVEGKLNGRKINSLICNATVVLAKESEPGTTFQHVTWKLEWKFLQQIFEQSSVMEANDRILSRTFLNAE